MKHAAIKTAPVAMTYEDRCFWREVYFHMWLHLALYFLLFVTYYSAVAPDYIYLAMKKG